MSTDEKSATKETQRQIEEANELKRFEGPVGGLMSFNIEYGYLEAMLRGFRTGFLKDQEYKQLVACETLEDLKLNLGDTDFVNVLSAMPQGSLTPEVIHNAFRDKYIKEFNFLRLQSTGSLSTFLEFITYEHLIESISFIVRGIIKGSAKESLLAGCHPLGVSPHLAGVLTFENSDGEGDGMLNLYKCVLVEMPVAPYFATYFNAMIESGAEAPSREIQKIYSEVELPIITAMIQKLWLEDFYAYTQSLGGDTAMHMKELLEFEADRRVIQITLNSFKDSLNEPNNRDLRTSLYPAFGKLYPYSIKARSEGSSGGGQDVADIYFRDVDNDVKLGEVLARWTVYHEIWQRAVAEGARTGGGISMDPFYAYEVQLCQAAFDGQSHFASFYAFYKLKEQELRNVHWITECIVQKREAADFNHWISIYPK